MQNNTNIKDYYLSDYFFKKNANYLEKNGNKIRLRRKESQVLALLCEKYPEPVSREDFLNEIWAGKYVSAQSIAQIIRKLRIYLSDDNKTVISTVFKYGYLLNIEPHA